MEGEVIKIPPKMPPSPPIFVVFGKGAQTNLESGRVDYEEESAQIQKAPGR